MVPEWLEADAENLKGTVKELPTEKPSMYQLMRCLSSSCILNNNYDLKGLRRHLCRAILTNLNKLIRYSFVPPQRRLSP